MVIDLRQSESWAKYLQTLGWVVEKLRITDYEGRNRRSLVASDTIRIYVRKIPLLGSLIKIQRPVEIPTIPQIDRIARKHHALLVKIEPPPISHQPLAGFGRDSNPNLPTKTLINDLTKSEREIWAGFSRDARQSIHKAENSRQLTASSHQFGDKGSKEKLDQFHKLLMETGQRQGFWVSDRYQLEKKCEAFGRRAILFLVFSAGQAAAGALFLISGDTVFYHHAASSALGQKLFAPYLLLWEALKFFKKMGISKLDHEGIVDPRFPQTKRWEKFTVFKRKWGGKEIEYPYPLVKYYSLPIKLLFKFGSLL